MSEQEKDRQERRDIGLMCLILLAYIGAVLAGGWPN